MSFKDIDIDGDNIALMVIVALVAIVIITITLSVRSCQLEETQKYLAAGCEQVYVPGRTESIWSNCKKPLEKEQ